MISATLRTLGLIDKNDAPTDAMMQLVDPKQNYAENLKVILVQSYPFISDGSIDLKNTTTEKVVEKFKQAGATGSTVSKCMAFFLAACKAAGIETSQYVKAPLPPRASGRPPKRRQGTKAREKLDVIHADPDDVDLDGMARITIPLHGMQDGRVYFPEDMTLAQWRYALRMTEFILQNYRLDVDEDKDEEKAGVDDSTEIDPSTP